MKAFMTDAIMKIVYSHTVDTGCPGGKKGNAEASTTRKPCTPYTLALESKTAIESFIAPILQVAAA